MSDKHVAKWFPKGGPYTLEESEKSLKSILSHWLKNGYGLWAITKKKDGSLIGRCGLNCILNTSEVEIDFIIKTNCWNKGYATEAAKAALFYGFKILKLNKIIALSKLENIASRRVIEKIGMHYIRNAMYWNITCAKYEILKTQYNTSFLV
jgi:ribosomal-protein-alanine N-acetyltransferase